MSFRDDTLNERRRELASKIAHQRGQLANAYRDLAKPIQYAETGLRGFNFLRQNPWVISVVPAGFTILSSMLGIVRGGKTPKLSRRAALVEEEERLARKAPRSFGGHVVKWGGRGWKLFRLYRKMRKFL
jgi:hypothetical protein